MNKLTKMELDVLRNCHDWSSAGEIRARLGYGTVAGVSRILLRLEFQGWVVWGEAQNTYKITVSGNLVRAAGAASHS